MEFNEFRLKNRNNVMKKADGISLFLFVYGP